MFVHLYFRGIPPLLSTACSLQRDGSEFFCIWARCYCRCHILFLALFAQAAEQDETSRSATLAKQARAEALSAAKREIERLKEERAKLEASLQNAAQRKQELAAKMPKAAAPAPTPTPVPAPVAKIPGEANS